MSDSHAPPHHDVHDETVLVSGAAGALGRVVLARLRASGRVPLALTHSEASAAGLRAAGVWAQAVELLDETAVATAVALAASEGRPPTSAILLAGGFATATAEATDLSQLRLMWDRNVGTAATVVRALLPGFRARGSGTIIGVAAGQARQGGRGASAYASAKAALASYLRAVDDEVSRSGLAAITVFPMGTIDTPANRAAMPSGDPAGWIDPASLADLLVKVLDTEPRARLRELVVYPDPR